MPKILKEFVLPIALAVISSLTTIAGTYLAVVKPRTEVVAQQTGATAGTAAGKSAADALVNERVPPAEAVPIAVDQVTQNKSTRLLFIVAFCGASHDPREIEGMVGEAREDMTLVASATGNGRINFTLPVLPRWWYHVRETTGRPCDFRGWTL